MALMYAIGLGTATMAVAKGVTTAYVASQRLQKVEVQEPVRWGQLFSDDDGDPDLSKTQMMVWTFLAVAIHSARLAASSLQCTAFGCPACRTSKHLSWS